MFILKHGSVWREPQTSHVNEGAFMKALKLKMFLPFVLASFFVVGCGKDDKGGSALQCNQFGQCFDPNGLQCDQFGNCFNPFNPNQPINNNPNAVTLEGGISVQNSENWRLALDGITNCKNQSFFGIGYCRSINAPPRIRVVFNDYKFTNNVSTGTLGIGNQFVPGQNYQVTWRRITTVGGRAGFEAQLFAPFEFYGKPLRLQVFGAATDAFMQANLYYGVALDGQAIENDPRYLIGTGTVVRRQ